MQTGFKNYNTIKDIQSKQQVEKEGTTKNLFSENAFQLQNQLNKAQAENQDYFRTGTPDKINKYFMSGAAEEDAKVAERANLLAKQDQLQNAGTAGILPLVDKGIEKDLIDTRFNLQQMNNPTEYNDFAEYFMSRPKQEQSMIMGLGYNEGGIASLNVNKK